VLWFKLAEGLCLKRGDGSHVCTLDQLRSLSLPDRSSVLLALALEAKRAESTAPDRATRAYRMLSYLLKAVTNEDLMPPSLRSAGLRFQEAAAAEFAQGALQWPSLPADKRQALLVSLARHHATCLAYRMPELKFGNHQGRPVMLALANGEMPVDTGDSQRWSSFEKMVQRLGQDLLPFWQFELARRFEGGVIALVDVDIARLMCVGNVPPLVKQHLASHVDERLAHEMDAMAPTARQISLHAQCWTQPLRPHQSVIPITFSMTRDNKA